MTTDSPDGDETRLARLLKSVDNEMALPDQQFLDELRKQSTAEFLKPARGNRSEHDSRSEEDEDSSGLFVGHRWAVVAAVLIVAGYWILMPSPGAGSKPVFGDVLKKMTEANTLHLRLMRDGETEEIWLRRPGLMRREEDRTRYEIVRGDRSWKIDETRRQVTVMQSAATGTASATIDLLQLIESSDGAERSKLVGHHPSERVEEKGVVCDRYRMRVDFNSKPVHLVALVVADTQQLLRLEASAERNGRLQPISTLQVVAYNPPIDDDKFRVTANFAEATHLGQIVDAQGIVTVQPVMQRRWTPVRGRMKLQPGDWIRTDVRGANAVRVQLNAENCITLGPGSLLELIGPNEARLHRGEAEVIGSTMSPITLHGPRAQSMAIDETSFLRLVDRNIVPIENKPRWLAGFEGSANEESLGSLIAKVDGRDVPLTVGYHKVSVDIRDQIARTTIEESFVNHTNSRLEGVFYFPLPQDASISGFGMWIGDELVEADVVEKQRAREIYETILREKRDPGLLEWAGGNIFKARVFPIFAHSEKRIKITYTQVLPMKGNRYRYRYPLQSEMLKQTPLRELSLDVKINSAAPIQSVECPTHSTRTDLTSHSAHVEFTAQEYTPTNDFEVVVTTDNRTSDVVMIPHRRGDDGYFLLQVMPPSPQGNWQRDILPDGEPLDLLLLADTSASIDESQRQRQAQFIATLLASL